MIKTIRFFHLQQLFDSPSAATMSRYNGPPRDRSPPRFLDRRSSTTYHSPPAHLSSRGDTDVGYNSVRDVPRGPKAENVRHGGPPTPRARGGFGPRSDLRDREGASPLFRRDSDRSDWSRRDREYSISERESYFPRDSRSYHPRDRSCSPDRLSRDSKDVPASGTRLSEAPSHWHSSGNRSGSVRGRVRADWDRGRGRGYVNERDGFRPRSRSRDVWHDRERPLRERGDADHRERFDRRENDRLIERDDRGWDSGLQGRDRSPNRTSTRIQSLGPSRSSTATSTHHAQSQGEDAGRRAANLLPTSLASPVVTSATTAIIGRGSGDRDVKREGNYVEQSFSAPKAKSPHREGLSQRAISPPSAPTVPAFGGSLDYVKPIKLQSVGAITETKISPEASTSITSGQPENKPAPASHEGSFQPPTGPKADRGLMTFQQTPKTIRPSSLESSLKLDSHPRPLRPTINTPTKPPPGTSLSESFADASSAGTSHEAKPSLLKPLGTKANIPQAPLSAPLVRRPSDVGSSKVLSPKPYGSIPTGPAAMDVSPIAPRLSNVPTGPRIAPKQHVNSWNTASFKPAGALGAPARPSIINSAPSKPAESVHRERNYSLPASQRNDTDLNMGQDIQTKPQRVTTENDQSPTDKQAGSPTLQHASAQSVGIPEKEATEAVESLLPVSPQASSDDEADDEDDGLDEQDFIESEQKFKKEMDILAAQRPLSPLQDPTIVSLLVRIQLLGLLAADVAPADMSMDVVEEEVRSDKFAEAVDLPYALANVANFGTSPPPRGRLLKEGPYNPIPTPPLEDLPFLSTSPPTKLKFFDSSDEDEEICHRVTDILQEDMSREAFEAESYKSRCRAEFVNSYRPWKLTVSEMDQRKRDEAPQIPAPASPPLSLPSTTVATPLIERTRGAKNITELDLQNIIKASEQSAREEQERRDRELTSKPNYDVEAMIPAMKDHDEIELCYYEDRCQYIPPERTLDVFAFVPPRDDFTTDEQKTFIAAFNRHPKKWSEIAECLPGRDYQQCILHYYLTKHTVKYKEIWRKTLPKKKRGRGPAVRPRSTALMSDMVFEREEIDGGSAAVTDTGRPRRAAAPTFGDTAAEADSNGTTSTAAVVPANNTPLPNTRRPGKEATGEQMNEKATARKRAGPKGPRKSKGTVVTAVAGTTTSRPTSTSAVAAVAADPLLAVSPLKADKEVQFAQVAERFDPIMSKIEDGTPVNMQVGSTDVGLSRPPTLVSTASTLDGTSSARPIGPVRSTSNKWTSYWPVPESQYFPTLIDYYGRDWAAISNFMETKSPNMVSQGEESPWLFLPSMIC